MDRPAARPISRLAPLATFVQRPGWRTAAGVSFAVILVLLLESSSVWHALHTGLRSLDFDSDRASLLEAWAGALLLAATGTLLTGRPWVSTLAALAFTLAAYVWPLALRLARNPPVLFGTPEQIQWETLVLRLSTAAGAAVILALSGAALADLLRRTIIEAGRWQRPLFHSSSPRYPLGAARRMHGLAHLGLLVLVGASIGLVATGVDPLLRFGPQHQIYRPQHSSLRSGPPAAGALTRATYYSQAMHGEREFKVFLPPGYRTSGRRYPVLYLLHGDPGDPGSWVNLGAPQILDAGYAAHRLPEVLVVMPDGNDPAYTATQWANSYDGKARVEDALLELVSVVDSRYRTMADRRFRAVAGLSSGGFGAANVGARHPDVWGTAISFSGYFMAEGPVFGDDPSYARANSPSLLVRDWPPARLVRYLLVVGADDGQYTRDSANFSRELDELAVPHQLKIVSGGHAAAVWREGLLFSLEQLAQDPAWAHPGRSKG